MADKDNKREKGFLSSVFSGSTLGSILKIAVISMATYFAFIPLDIVMDAARYSFVHSQEAAPLVMWASQNLSWVFDFFGFTGDDGIFSTVLDNMTQEQQLALAPDPSVMQQMTQNDGFSADSVFGSGPE